MAKKTPAALYRSMHSGLTPRVRRVAPPPTPKAVVDLRRVTAIEGIQLQGRGRVQGSGPILYRHDFEDGAGPIIARDVGRSRNNAVLVGGSYRINDEGMIEDTMAKKKHWMKRYTNPESNLEFLGMVGLALAFVGIANELIQSFLPASWSARTKMIGMEALLIVGGVMVYKKSPVWGIALAGVGISGVTNGLYVAVGLDAKVRKLLHRPAANTVTAPRTYSTVTNNADGSYSVTYSDGTSATLPAGTSPLPTVGMAAPSAGLYRQLGAPQAVSGGWQRPRVAAQH